MWIQNSPSLPSTKELNQITVRTPNTKFLYLMLTFPSCLHHSTSFWRCLTQNNSSSTLCGRHPALYKLLENIKVVQGEVYFFYITTLKEKEQNASPDYNTLKRRSTTKNRSCGSYSPTQHSFVPDWSVMRECFKENIPYIFSAFFYMPPVLFSTIPFLLSSLLTDARIFIRNAVLY